MDFTAEEKAVFRVQFDGNLEEYIYAGNIAGLEWRMSLGEMNEDLQSMAESYGQLEMMKWLKEHGYHLHEKLSANAARSGRYDIVVWLLDNDCPVSERIVMSAVRSGNMNLVKYLLNKNYPLPTSAFAAACRSGNLQLVKFLQKKEYDGDDYPSVCAVVYGHQDVLEWLFLSGYAMSPRLRELACYNNRTEIGYWLACRNL